MEGRHRQEVVSRPPDTPYSLSRAHSFSCRWCDPDGSSSSREEQEEEEDPAAVLRAHLLGEAGLNTLLLMGLGWAGGQVGR